MFLLHMLACTYYAVGNATAYLGTGHRVAGWVEEEAGWDRNNSDSSVTNNDCSESLGLGSVSLASTVDCRISVWTLYSTSMYYVLNALEHSSTPAERSVHVPPSAHSPMSQRKLPAQHF